MIANKIDHTLLRPTATLLDIEKLCQECITHKFRSVCVASSFVKEARKFCVPVTTTIGYPHGNCSTSTKMMEAVTACMEGATEIDVVCNLGWLKYKRPLEVMLELSAIVKSVVPNRVKAVVESGYLTADEQIAVYSIVKDSGAYCIQTSVGYYPEVSNITKWATIKARKDLGDLQIKAFGGIKNLEIAKKLLGAGADIIGTSHSIQILEAYVNEMP